MKPTATTASVLLPLLLTACSGGENTADTALGTDTATAAAVPAAPAAPTAAGETSGFKVPESVRYDADLDVYFVSNINGNPSNKDNNGFIAIVQPDSTSSMRMLVEGGRNGATLHAPKGMAVVGDTLWVTDIDVVRGFNKRTGALVATVAMPGATFLNDIAQGSDGVYVTDTNIRFGADGSMSNPGTDAIFRIAGRTVTRAASGEAFARPNGIAWDASGSRFVVVPFGANTLMTWKAGDAAPATLGPAGPGQYDGVEVLADGRVLVTSWADSSVYALSNGALNRIATGLPAPADIGVDTKRNLLLVPLFNDGKVTYWKL